MSVVFRLAHGVMAALFAISALLQFNDPDPVPWIALYLGAAAAAAAAALQRPAPARALSGIVFVVCIIWEINFIRLQAWQTPWCNLTQEWHMTSEAIVHGREFWALIWIAGWMLLVALTARRKPPPADPA